MRNPDPANRRYTSLAWAAILGHTETFEFLLSAGHDDQEFSRVCHPSAHLYPRPPLTMGRTTQDSDDNTILILLADSKPSVTSPQRLDPDERDVIGAALRMAVLYYERYPETLDWANSQGRTALHVAALKGNEDLVRVRYFWPVLFASWVYRSPRRSATLEPTTTFQTTKGTPRYISEHSWLHSGGTTLSVSLL